MNSRADGTGDAPALIALGRPRPLSPAERSLLDALVSRVPADALTDQVARAEVVSRCSCGCPSVGLRTDGRGLSPEVVAELGNAGRPDLLDVTAWAIGRGGRAVQVTLHVVAGLVEELEIWHGSAHEEVVTDLPEAESLLPDVWLLVLDSMQHGVESAETMCNCGELPPHGLALLPEARLLDVLEAMLAAGVIEAQEFHGPGSPAGQGYNSVAGPERNRLDRYWYRPTPAGQELWRDGWKILDAYYEAHPITDR